MKKSRLKVEYVYDFELLGICCACKEYKLAFHINQAFQVRLIKKDDLNLDFLASTLSVSNFLYETDHCRIRLLKNRAVDVGKKFLLPELHHFDYLILIEDELGNFDLDNVILQLKKVAELTYVVRVSTENLKSKENLIF